jgi:hypothetical protein
MLPECVCVYVNIHTHIHTHTHTHTHTHIHTYTHTHTHTHTYAEVGVGHGYNVYKRHMCCMQIWKYVQKTLLETVLYIGMGLLLPGLVFFISRIHLKTCLPFMPLCHYGIWFILYLVSMTYDIWHMTYGHMTPLRCMLYVCMYVCITIIDTIIHHINNNNAY